MPDCDICGNNTRWEDGFVISTTEVVTSPSYWEYLIKKDKVQEESLGVFIKMMASHAGGWIICESCGNNYSFNEARASQQAKKKSLVLPKVESANLYETGMIAGVVWHKRKGSWPSTIQLPSGPPSEQEITAIRNKLYLTNPEQELNETSITNISPDAFPRICVVCSSLPKSDFSSDEDMHWLMTNRNVAISQFYEIKESAVLQALIKSFEENNFTTQVLCEISQDDIRSGEVDELTKVFLDISGLSRDEFNLQSLLIKDQLGRTEYIRICFYFKNDLFREKKWWQFWR